jgi:hypothetical protein
MTNAQSMAAMLLDKGVTAHMINNPDEATVLALADRAMEKASPDVSDMMDTCAIALSQRGELSARELSRICGVPSASVASALRRDDRFTYTYSGRTGRMWRMK